MNKLVSEMTTSITGMMSEIEDLLWDLQSRCPGIYFGFDNKALKSSCKMFADCLLELAHKKNIKEGMSQQDRERQAIIMGNKIRDLVIEFTGIDLHSHSKTKTETN